jgi:phosphoglycerate kinase
MNKIDNYNFEGKKVLIRVDFNVPLDDSLNVADDTRILSAIPTIKKIISKGGSPILLSHLGRPKGKKNDQLSLQHIVSCLSSHLGQKVHFSNQCVGEKAELFCKNLKKGEVALLENLRFHIEETDGDIEFSKQLSNLGDVYVNDAFGTAHRAHSSTTIIATFFPHDKLFGYLLEKELASISQALKDGRPPKVAILGGAKISGKIEVITSLLNKVDKLIIGGGMAFTFIKAKNGKIGNSMVENDHINTALNVYKLAAEKGVELLLPNDAVITTEFSNNTPIQISNIETIPEGWMGLDIGPKSIELFKSAIKNSNTILWNGPMGVFEMSNFEKGTKDIALEIANQTNTKGAFSLVGGGDSVAAINKYNLGEEVSYVSTGGGALLEYLEGKILPGVAAITN